MITGAKTKNIDYWLTCLLHGTLQLCSGSTVLRFWCSGSFNFNTFTYLLSV